jgi:hypothetical protein
MRIKFKNGSALLLAFLIMTAILSSVLYVSRFSLRQIIQSQSTDNANIAFYGAESGNEQAIYYLRKTDEPFDSDFLNLINPTFMHGSGQEDATITRTVANTAPSINIGLRKNQFFQFDLFDPEYFYESSKLSSLEISWDDNCSTPDDPNNSWIELTVNEWSSSLGDDSVNWAQSAHHVYKDLLSASPYTGANKIIHVGGSYFDEDKIYQFRVKALFCDIYNLNIVALDSAGERLLFKNIYTIKTVAQYPGNSEKGNKQALSVSLRALDPLSGLFDYVIFSEQSLVKDELR